MKKIFTFLILVGSIYWLWGCIGCTKINESSQNKHVGDTTVIDTIVTAKPLIIDHKSTVLLSIPSLYINLAKSNLHIAYNHTSHGSQLIDAMTGLYNWKGVLYDWNGDGSGSGLDIRDQFTGVWCDLGCDWRPPDDPPNYTRWYDLTVSYLDSSASNGINVIMWSWCDENPTVADINTYLLEMSRLENNYPKIKFIYMTLPCDGTGLIGNVHLRNNQIRDYCTANNKILYDFEDIESYDPIGNYFGDKLVTDACNYDYNGDGVVDIDWSTNPRVAILPDHNWGIDWQNSHTVNIDWYNQPVAHTQPISGNLKAYAAWWLWAKLAGWK